MEDELSTLEENMEKIDEREESHRREIAESEREISELEALLERESQDDPTLGPRIQVRMTHKI